MAIANQPADPWQTCLFTATGTAQVTGTGVDQNYVINDIECTTNSYPVNLTITGLEYDHLDLQFNSDPADSFSPTDSDIILS